MIEYVPVEHDPFNDPDPMPGGRDPFSLGPTPKPGQSVPPQDLLGDLNSITAGASRFLAPNLYALAHPRPCPAPALPAQGKVPPSDPPSAWPGVLADLAGSAMMAVPGGGLVGPAGRVAAEARSLVGRGVFGASRDAETLASKSAGLYNPPVKPLRPFSADYSVGVPGEPGTPLATDIERRPLTAAYIAGRQVVGGPDEPLSGPQIFSAATGITGTNPTGVAGRTIGGDAGRYIYDIDRRSGQILDSRFVYDRSLGPAQMDRVIAHELGHAIDQVAGQIPQDGIKADLKQFYSTLQGGGERTYNLTGPQHLGYSASEVPRELMAEAIRGYIFSPNYIKTMFPDLAAAIRGAVNAHSVFSKFIQFNAIPAFAAGTAAGCQLVPVDHDPFAR